MAGPELKTYSSVVAVLEKQQQLVGEMFQANGTGKAGVEKARELDLVSLKILKEVPAFIGTDMKEYGPFSANQTVELPFAISKLFMERRLAERNEE